MGEFSGKNVFVTGGASGIGHATALKFIEQGATVLITDLNEKAGTEIANNHENLFFAPHDVADEKSWQQAIAKMKSICGSMDILVNCAGVSFSDPLEDMTLERWRQQQAVNVDGTFLGVKYAIREMKERKGAIVNIASIASDVGIFAAVGYCATKGAVKSLTKAAALYCAQYKYDIRVNAIQPGYIETPMVTDVLHINKDAERLAQKLKKMHPLGHFGEPDDIAHAILFAASDRAKFMTGTSIPVDGGYLAQ
ncbi:SDR family NAD(P)-dependent oxidoreductase [Sneathiella glossodoripedis]|uniref:SDR family NAD(P)-dependent oxidoreductase n=1 Tax=Sneathiella glossodoripedis TaxID=418853 RepID=UPI00046F1D3C|nr:SDR family oxidoreductase [Sneathiella glossodoripedis]